MGTEPREELAKAQYNAGLMDENGRCVEKDMKKAFEFKSAAELGNPMAQYNLHIAKMEKG